MDYMHHDLIQRTVHLESLQHAVEWETNRRLEAERVRDDALQRAETAEARQAELEAKLALFAKPLKSKIVDSPLVEDGKILTKISQHDLAARESSQDAIPNALRVSTPNAIRAFATKL